MHVTLQVVTSVRIQRKKPWSKLAWIGEEKENLFLVENQRVSILYIPSGKTKRKIEKLQPFLKDCVCLSHTKSGSFILGLLKSGGVFLWHKDNDKLFQIIELPELRSLLSALNESRKWKRVFSDDSGHLILVIIIVSNSSPEIFLCDRLSSEFSSADRWWKICQDVENPLVSNTDLTLDVCFLQESKLGYSVQCAFVHNTSGVLCITTLLLTSPTTNDSFVHQWFTFKLSQTPDDCREAERSSQQRRYLVRWSHDGCIAAVVVNRNVARECQVLFVGIHCNVILATKLPYEERSPHHEAKRYHWVCDCAWTHNDLFLVVINRLGSVFLLSKLGVPMIISTHGCSMDLPPASCLPIHPLVFVRTETKKNADDSVATITTNTSDCVLKQRFSVSCHPRLPIVLCSDGYLVTCLRLPKVLSEPHLAVYAYLREAQKDLRRLGNLNHTGDQPASNVMKADCNKHDVSGKMTLFRNYKAVFKQWEKQLADGDDDEPSEDSSVHVVNKQSVIGNAESGTISFGICGVELDSTVFANKQTKDSVSFLEKETENCLLAAWSIVVTTMETWAVEWETRARNIAEILVKLCSQNCATQNIGDDGVKSTSSYVLQAVTKTISITSRFLFLCRFDGIGKNTFPVILHLVRSVLKTLLALMCKANLTMQSEVLFSIVSFVASVRETIIDTFSWNPLKLTSGSRAFSDLDMYVSSSIDCGTTAEIVVNKVNVERRLVCIWRKLYRHAKRLYCHKKPDVVDSQLVVVMGFLQRAIFKQRDGVCLKRGITFTKTTPDQWRYFLVPSERELVLAKWIQEVDSMCQGEQELCKSGTSHLTNLLHAVLYSHIERYDLKEAFDFIGHVLALKGNTTLSSRPVRSFVKSFARLLSSYFLMKPLYIHPWHHPLPLPNPTKKQRKSHPIFLDHRKIVENVTSGKLGHLWSVDVAVTLFLVTGFPDEAVVLLNAIGNLKAAFVVSLAMKLFRTGSKTLNLDDFLLRHLHSVLMQLTESADSLVLDNVVTEDMLRCTTEECFVVATLCDVHILPSVLEGLLSKLKGLVQSFEEVLVPDSVYLPRPPIYCPPLKDPVTGEDYTMAEVYLSLRNFAIVLSSSRCLVPVILRYVTELEDAALRVSPQNDWPLTKLLQKLNDLVEVSGVACHAQSPDLSEVVAAFRDVCTLAWFLNVRDKASRHFRKFRIHVEAFKSHKSKALRTAYFETLQWLIRLIPFAEFMNWNLDVYHLIFSVLLDGPADERASAILARCFPDLAKVPDELDYRFRRLLTVWHRTSIKNIDKKCHVKVKKPVSFKRLSVIHLEQCKEMSKVMTKLQSDVGSFVENVFTTDEPTITVDMSEKVRPFEVDRYYYEFLELFLEVAFLRDVNNYTESLLSWPLVPSARKFETDVRLSSISDELTLTRRHTEEVNTVPGKQGLTDLEDRSVRSKSSKTGLFRSLSFNDLQNYAKTTSAVPLSPTRTLSRVNFRKTKVSREISCPAFRDEIRPKTKKETKARRHSLNESVNRNGPSSNLLYICDMYSWEQMSACCGHDNGHHPRNYYSYYIKLFVWLVQWVERNSAVEKMIAAQSTAGQVHLNVTQVFSTIWQRRNINQESSQQNVRSQFTKSSVPSREFATSTPCRTEILPSFNQNLSLDEPDSISSVSSHLCSTNTNAFLSSYFQMLRKYVESDDDVTISSSSRASSGKMVNSLSDKFLHGTFNTIINDSVEDLDFPSSSDIINDNSNDTVTACTSKWSTSSKSIAGGRILLDVRKSTMLNVNRQKDVNQLAMDSKPKSDLVLPLTEDVACGDVFVWPDVVNTSVQVNERSLQDGNDSYNSHDGERRLSKSSDVVWSESMHRQYEERQPRALNRQKPVDRVRRRKHDDQSSDCRRHGIIASSQRFPAEREYCLLDLETLRKLSYTSERRTTEVRDEPSRCFNNGVSLNRIPRLLTLNSSSTAPSTIIPTAIFRKRYPDCVPRLSVEQLRNRFENETLSSSPAPKSNGILTETKQQRPHDRRGIAVETSTVDLCLTKNATTNTSEERKLPHCAHAYVGTEVLQSVTVGINTDACTANVVNRASSPGLVLPQADVVQLQPEVKETFATKLPAFELKGTISDVTTQTDASSPPRKSSPSKFDACVNTECIEKDPVKFLENRSSDECSTNDIVANVQEREIDDGEWWSKLSDPGRVIYRKLKDADSETLLLQQQMLDTKKMIEELDERTTELFSATLETLDVKGISVEEVGILERQRTSQENANVIKAEVRGSPPPSVLITSETRQNGKAKKGLREWMRRKSLLQQRAFMQELSHLRAKERQPFVIKGEQAKSREILKMERERKEKRKTVASSNFVARTDEAMQLLKSLVEDQLPSTVSTSVGVVKAKQMDSKADENNRYILQKGLKTLSSSSLQSQNDRRMSERRIMLSSPPPPPTIRPSSGRPNLEPTEAEVSGRSSLDSSLSSWSVPSDVRRIVYTDYSTNDILDMDGRKNRPYNADDDFSSEELEATLQDCEC